MKKWLMAVLFGSALVLGACGGGGDATDDSGDAGDDGDDVEASAGEEAYQDSCASCHGGNLEGGAGPELEDVGSEFSEDEIEDIIENGIGSMPPQDQVSDEDRTAIAEWLVEQ